MRENNYTYGRASNSILPMSTILPEHIREALVASSKVESRIDPGESPERAAAVDDAVKAARKANPEFFKKEK